MEQLIHGNWETVNGTYPGSAGITTLIVNPTCLLNFILNGNVSTSTKYLSTNPTY